MYTTARATSSTDIVWFGSDAAIGLAQLCGAVLVDCGGGVTDVDLPARDVVPATVEGC